MDKPDVVELLVYLDLLITSTQSGDTVWRAANPTTLTWTTASPPGRVVLQRVEKRTPPIPGRPVSSPTVHYVFQVLEAAGLQRLTVSGEEDSEINQKLDVLYQAAAARMSRGGLDFLKSLLGMS